MKKLLCICLLFYSYTCCAQARYNYYFFSVRATGKAQVEFSGTYAETDSILVENFEVNKKGDTTINYKKFKSYSDVFNRLGTIGLEYVQFASLPMVGGATRMLVGDIRIDWVIFRKKIE